MKFIKLDDGQRYINPEAITAVEKAGDRLIVALKSGGIEEIREPSDVEVVLAFLNQRSADYL